MTKPIRTINRPLSVLEKLVTTLNQYNESDMLDGYLDALADIYNEDLELLGLDTIKRVGNEDE